MPFTVAGEPPMRRRCLVARPLAFAILMLMPHGL
jgi:hypothetical protein